MSEQTHYQLGLHYYCVFAFLFGGLGISALAFGKITLLCVLWVVCGSLFPIIGDEHSTSRSGNKIYRYFESRKIFDFFYYVYLLAFSLLAICLPIMFYDGQFHTEYAALIDLSPHADLMLIFAYVLYLAFLAAYIKFRKRLKRTVLYIWVLLYFMLLLDLSSGNTLFSILVVLFIYFSTAFSRRTFTHSLEGLLAYSACALYISRSFEFTYLGI